VSRTSRRAILAVVASAIGAAVGIAGVGHVYLREWRRAAAWFALVVGSALVLGAVFVDPGADPANLSPESIPATVTLPIAALLLLSMLDAYLVASRSTPDDEESTAPACPHCGKELDGDLDFCPWCTTRLEAVDGADATSR
jgi:hypothetical protein